MAFNGLFTIDQGTDPTSFSLNDVSTGSDPGLTGRRIYLFLYDGTTLVPSGTSTDYIDWPLSDRSTKTLTGILQKDYSINIEVQWISSSPLAPPSTYVYNILQTFTDNLRLFSYGLTQMQASNPLLPSDNDWYYNKMKLRLFIEDADETTEFNDQINAQLSLNSGYKLEVNKNAYF